MDARGAAERLPQHRIRRHRPIGRRGVDPRQVLHHDAAGAEVQMPDLGVAHLPVGKPHGQPGRGQGGRRIPLPERVEHGRRGQRDCVARAVRREPPAVEHDQRRARDRERRRSLRRRAISVTRRGHDRAERVGVQRRPADERAIDVGQRQQLGRVVGLDRPAVQDPGTRRPARASDRRPARGRTRSPPGPARASPPARSRSPRSARRRSPARRGGRCRRGPGPPGPGGAACAGCRRSHARTRSRRRTGSPEARPPAPPGPFARAPCRSRRTARGARSGRARRRRRRARSASAPTPRR